MAKTILPAKVTPVLSVEKAGGASPVESHPAGPVAVAALEVALPTGPIAHHALGDGVGGTRHDGGGDSGDYELSHVVGFYWGWRLNYPGGCPVIHFTTR